jgi:uncharacterized RDD family membrane protein YckC
VSLPGTVAHSLGYSIADVWLNFAVETALWLLYFAAFTASAWQATPGKRWFGIKVTDLSGRRIGIGRSIVRAVASVLSWVALFGGYLLALVTPRRQALHDLMAGTVVVDADLQPGALPPDRQVMPLSRHTIASAAAWMFLFLAYVAASAFLVTPPDEMRFSGAVPAGSSADAPARLGYQLYKQPLFGGDRELVREGMLEYRLSDVQVTAGPDGSRTSFVKRLAVTDGVSIDAHIYREPAINGFGLTLEKGFGFSWEWFDLEGDYVFRKRQGPGRIQVRMNNVDGLEEIAEILFLEDVTLRHHRFWLGDHLVVKKGSVLKLSGSDPDNYLFHVARSRFSSRE